MKLDNDKLGSDPNHINSPSFELSFEPGFEAFLHSVPDQDFSIPSVADVASKGLFSLFTGLSWPSMTSNYYEIFTNIFPQLQATFCERYSGELIMGIQNLLDPFCEDSFAQLLKISVFRTGIGRGL